ncbi:DUF2283 domain-containing protein [uncultured Brevundimonas sp.]|uniref:DUF2283 domain-containing protein n=1 Tax=uncultured Brevundimonas sp. TaxID=213418 RepID=UPI002608DF2B|nr:DUF2283 domain-containing protein [uncultured Brevundimonas sp.]
MAPEITYDPEADALYIRLSDERPVEGADAGPFVLDYSADNKVVGIELLSASTVLAPGDWTRAPRPSAGKDGHACAAE